MYDTKVDCPLLRGLLHTYKYMLATIHLLSYLLFPQFHWRGLVAPGPCLAPCLAGLGFGYLLIMKYHYSQLYREIFVG